MGIIPADNLRERASERESISAHYREGERERGGERESGAALNHVARPHISLCSCVRQSERQRGESTSESGGNSRTTYHLAERSMRLRQATQEG